MSENSEDKKSGFTFEISLSVLNHLGRNLYRSFATVLGEAISNSWDAGANNVWIYIDRESNSFVVKDDGDGMDSDDFQNKFLKIGYSKRNTGVHTARVGDVVRPFIGRKGIGKLALLSCAEKITVLSKKAGGEYVGGVIDNSELDGTIEKDGSPSDYLLGTPSDGRLEKYKAGHDKGTIIFFSDLKEGIKASLPFIKKVIALYFRFSLIDNDFNIFVDDEKVTHKHLDDLAKKTQFVWKTADFHDPMLESEELKPIEVTSLNLGSGVWGFVASVKKPRDLSILSTGERVSIDLFVNGRLREKDILQHVPTSRLAENYFYGQIHYNDLDDTEKDRFASSREGIVADDEKFEAFRQLLQPEMTRIAEAWDKLRVKHRMEGDAEGSTPPKERIAKSLYNVVSGDYDLPEGSTNKDEVEQWAAELADDASLNFESYADCFISESLLRKYIEKKAIPLGPDEIGVADKFRRIESAQKIAANLNIDIRKQDTNLNRLEIKNLAGLVDEPAGQTNTIAHDAKEYTPIRDAVMHTALLTDEAKIKLKSVFNNIRARIKKLLADR